MEIYSRDQKIHEVVALTGRRRLVPDPVARTLLVAVMQLSDQAANDLLGSTGAAMLQERAHKTELKSVGVEADVGLTSPAVPHLVVRAIYGRNAGFCHALGRKGSFRLR
uniref:Uncharacterized protein n=1 Tax=Arundo donax TaxID=35708 RepID=A0A0A8XPY2_ARUDO